ncbi:hypothetical protein LguiA_012968 [Lonicera macranthoides]
MVSGLINANPTVYEKKERRARTGPGPGDVDEYAVELKVISEEAVEVNDENSHVRVTFTPTVEHCSMATVIGLCLRVKLMRSLPSRYKCTAIAKGGLVISEQSVEEWKMHLCGTWHFGSNRRMEQRHISPSLYWPANPTVYEKKERRARTGPGPGDVDEDIKDPEHPYSLEELKVISEEAVEVNDENSHMRMGLKRVVLRVILILVGCIGLAYVGKNGITWNCFMCKKEVDIRVAPGTHATEAAVNKQLNDKERVAAALENPNLVDMVDECLAPSYA